MPEHDANKNGANDWQSLLIASNQQLLNSGLRMAQIGPDAGTMILQWTQVASLHQAEFGARSLKLAVQLVAPAAGGNAAANAVETTARMAELANDYMRGLADLQQTMFSDAAALGARLHGRR
jgi:hypothetical protein